MHLSTGDMLGGLVIDVFDRVVVVQSSAYWVQMYRGFIEKAIHTTLCNDLSTSGSDGSSSSSDDDIDGVRLVWRKLSNRLLLDGYDSNIDIDKDKDSNIDIDSNRLLLDGYDIDKDSNDIDIDIDRDVNSNTNDIDTLIDREIDGEIDRSVIVEENGVLYHTYPNDRYLIVSLSNI
jgi:hypothetical protein